MLDMDFVLSQSTQRKREMNVSKHLPHLRHEIKYDFQLCKCKPQVANETSHWVAVAFKIWILGRHIFSAPVPPSHTFL